MNVRLESHEVFQAAQVGVMRRVANLRLSGVSEPHGGPDEAWWADITGACGELAVARYLDRYWSGQLGNYKARDVGPVQVRTTRHPDGRLILHKTDADDHAFVLVTGEAPQFVLAGWIWGSDGKLAEYWSAPKGRWAFWVPQSALHPMSYLRAALDGKSPPVIRTGGR